MGTTDSKNSISVYSKKVKRAFLFGLDNAWKNKSIPQEQLVLVEKALEDFSSGKKFEAFDIAVNLLRKIPTSQKKILEIGCSSGYYNQVFDIAGLNLKYEGCDYSAEFIKLAREIYPNVKFKVCNAKKLDYKERNFDITMLGGVLLHIKNWQEAIKEAARVSKRYIFIHRSPIVHLEKTLFLLKKAYGVKMFEVILSEGELLDELRKNDFGVIAVKTYNPTDLKFTSDRVYMKSYLAERVTTKLSPKPK